LFSYTYPSTPFRSSSFPFLPRPPFARQDPERVFTISSSPESPRGASPSFTALRHGSSIRWIPDHPSLIHPRTSSHGLTALGRDRSNRVNL
jgi:hypothetical protein